MNNDSNLIELHLQIELPDADAEEIDHISRNIRRDLLDLNVDSVEPVSGGPAPEGTKAVDWNLLGEWVVKVGVAAVPGVFELLKSKQERAPASTPLKIKVKVSRHRQVEIEYDPAHTTPEQLAELVKRLQQSFE